MPPTPRDTTDRIRAHYSGPLGSHTMLFHAVTGSTRAEFLGSVQDFIDDAKELQYEGTVWDTADFASAGSDLFFPMSDWTVITSDTTQNPDDNSSPSQFLNFVGRTTGEGVRVKLYLFETYARDRQDMRWDAGESSAIDLCITELNSVDNVIGAINGGVVAWKTYANVGQNDHLTHKARR